MNDTGSKIKLIRKEIIKKTQKEFCADISISLKTLSNWEQGYSKPTIERLITISSIYNISLDYLILDDEDISLLTDDLTFEMKQTLSQLASLFRN